MLFRHKEFVKNHIAGYTDENVILIENGDVLELEENSARLVAHHQLERTFIDEESLGEIEYDTIRERKKLAYGGAISLVVTIDRESREVVESPQITFQGVAGVDFTNGMVEEARQSIMESIKAMSKKDLHDRGSFKENLRILLKRFIQKETGTKPVIIPTIVEV
jgi:ribonuclease J